MMRYTCKLCRFFDVLESGGGLCRRSPPRVFYQEEMGDVAYRGRVCETLWPFVNDKDWCGEHRLKENG